MTAGLPIAVVVLAAGNSSRLGRPKQLLPFAGATLLRHAVETALAARLGPVFVVLGSREEECRETLVGLPVTILTNPNWEQGMGSSIAYAMQTVTEDAYRAVLITLCDQPRVMTNDLRALASRLTEGTIVASAYGETVGPPVLFAAPHFARLRELPGAQGAKALFHGHPGLITVPCAHAAVDVDTEEDVRSLRG